MEEEFLIAGGGIAGLSAALAIAATGRKARVFEQAKKFQEFGAGLQMGPNAGHALEHLGIAAKVDEFAGFPEEVRILDGVSGKVLNTVTLGEEFTARYGAPYCVIHRGDLLRVLVNACTNRKAVELNRGAKVTGVESNDEGATLVLGRKKVSGAGIIGADGIRSTVRALTLKDGPPELAGHVIGRAIVPADIMPFPEPAVCLWLLPRGHVVHYPIRGGDDFNLVAAFSSEWDEQDWNAPAEKAEIEAHFEHSTGLVRQILAAAPEWRKWVAADRAPRGRWGDGPVTLLGDAAHAVLPYFAQGAAMALEDACVLARMLHSNSDVASAMRAYEDERSPRVGRLNEMSRKLGNAYHAGGPVRFLRNAILRAMSENASRNRLDWVYRWKT